MNPQENPPLDDAAFRARLDRAMQRHAATQPAYWPVTDNAAQPGTRRHRPMTDAHNEAAAQELLNLAANDPALDDAQFVLVSRLLRGEQISPEAGDPAATRYFVDLDGGGDLTLWIGTGPDDPNCQPVARKFKLDAEDPVLWPTVVQALTGQAADGGAS